MLEFIVEDGTSKEDSNSYVSITYADQYAENFGYSDWDTYSITTKEKYLIQATQYIDLSFNFNSIIENIGSYKTESEQALEFPREKMYCNNVLIDNNVIPAQLKKAVVETAIKRGLNDSRLISDSGEVLKSEQVGDLKIERFDNSSRGSTITRYPQVELLLKCLGRFGNSNAIIQVRT